MIKVKKLKTKVQLIRDVSRPFGRPVYRFEPPNLVAQKAPNQKQVEGAINDFTKIELFPNGFEQNNADRRVNNNTKRRRNETTIFLRKCFHLFEYAIDHKSVRFFFSIFLRTCSRSLNDVIVYTTSCDSFCTLISSDRFVALTGLLQSYKFCF